MRIASSSEVSESVCSSNVRDEGTERFPLTSGREVDDPDPDREAPLPPAELLEEPLAWAWKEPPDTGPAWVAGF